MAYAKSGLTLFAGVVVLLFFCGLLYLTPAAASAPEESAALLRVSLPAAVKGYTSCTITIDSPAPGEIELRLYDSLENPWLVRRETVSAGENLLSWDGLGANRERLMSGPYRFDVTLRADDGTEHTASARFSIQGFVPALALALPSSDILYLDQKESWFVECYVPVACIVAMEIRDPEGNAVFSRSTLLKDEDRDTLYWNGVGNSRKKVTPGTYTVRLYAKLNPDFDFTFPLSVEETTPEKPPVSVTGPVLPERGMSGEEIWEIMMKPSVVINDKGSSLRFSLLESPDTRSASAGVVCCATQGLEVLALEGNWAQLRAWNYHNGSEEIIGWYPVQKLTVLLPAPHYAVLVDKREQTLTVWQDGKPIGTVPVSTGLPAEKQPERETPPGAFLTDVHFSPDFAQDGMRYDYPLRYQGGNIIHSTGFVRIPHSSYSVKDYSKNLPLLGQKASHGCVRVSPFASADGSINSFWLWTHLSYQTRVIILGD